MVYLSLSTDPLDLFRKETIVPLFPMPSCPQMNFSGLWLAKYKSWKHKEQTVIDKPFVFKLFMWLFSNNTKLSLSLKNRKYFLTHQVFKSAQHDGWAHAWMRPRTKEVSERLLLKPYMLLGLLPWAGT